MDGIYWISGLGILVWCVGLIRGSGLDKYLLNGYNTASEAERVEMDKPMYIRNFRKFHLFLGSAIILIGAGVYEFVDADYGIMTSILVMLGGYIILFRYPDKFGGAGSDLSPKFSMWIITAVIVLVATVFFFGMSSNDISILKDRISIDGMYGEEVLRADIQSVSVVDEFPKPRSKSNGFALSKTKKGWFVNSKGQNVKLIIEDIDSTLLHIRTKAGLDIYYQNNDVTSSVLHSQILEQWPDVTRE